MKCPQCEYPNPQGATHCQMCYEVFNKSAADRYLHAQKRARRMENNEQPPPEPARKSNPAPEAQPIQTRILTEVSNIDWDALLARFANFVQIGISYLKTFRKEIGMGAGIIALVGLVLFYTSAGKRLEFFGTRLRYDFRPAAPVTYLVGLHTEYKSWSEREGRLDTPLDAVQKDELGHIRLMPTRAQPKTVFVTFQPQDWIITQLGMISQNVPLSHPSLGGVTKAFVDRYGVVSQWQTTYSTRLGRASGFVLPRWPQGTHRPGDRWDEPVAWVEAIGDWKILWKGRLHWTMGKLVVNEGIPCIHLSYRADLQPTLWEPPVWARGAVHQIVFNGTAGGDVYVDTKRHYLLDNTFDHEGVLRIGIDNIYRIPLEIRVGREPRRRYGQRAAAVPGTILLQLKEKLTVHRP